MEVWGGNREAVMGDESIVRELRRFGEGNRNNWGWILFEILRRQISAMRNTLICTSRVLCFNLFLSLRDICLQVCSRREKLNNVVTYVIFHPLIIEYRNSPWMIELSFKYLSLSISSLNSNRPCSFRNIYIMLLCFHKVYKINVSA